MNNIPCYGCKERTTRCHAGCERYLTAKESARRVIEWLHDQNRRSFDAERVTFQITAKRRYAR